MVLLYCCCRLQINTLRGGRPGDTCLLPKSPAMRRFLIGRVLIFSLNPVPSPYIPSAFLHGIHASCVPGGSIFIPSFRPRPFAASFRGAAFCSALQHQHGENNDALPMIDVYDPSHSIAEFCTDGILSLFSSFWPGSTPYIYTALQIQRDTHTRRFLVYSFIVSAMAPLFPSSKRSRTRNSNSKPTTPLSMRRPYIFSWVAHFCACQWFLGHMYETNVGCWLPRNESTACLQRSCDCTRMPQAGKKE